MSPVILLKAPVLSAVPPCIFFNAGYKICLINVDLPLPLTPVTTVKHSKGISTEIFLRLFSSAPFIRILLLHFLLFLGIGIDNFPVRYLAVKLLSPFTNSEWSP